MAMDPQTLSPASKASTQPNSGLTFALQALLQRHESYLAESSAERLRLTDTISTLEQEKEQVQARNNALVAENRALLNDLERVNNEVGLADGKISSMTAMLAEAQFEVRRLNGMARRAEELEKELAQYDQKHHVLEREVEETQEAEKSAIGRWKDAERRTRDLNEQVERIEREARREREAHAELIGRMERRRKVEQELEGAAGRLKGAAAVAAAAQDPGGGSKVDSHFVRDILQDNANLQSGITELRELLQNSNEEVQNLREQVITHQPVTSHQEDGEEIVTTPLNEELQWAAPSRQVSQEVHVHHHYHAKFAAKKPPLTRRGSKKRNSPGLLTPTHGSPVPLSPSTRHANLALSTSYQQPPKSRWSVQSVATGSSTVGSSTISSMPNSPPYYPHGGRSMFDRIEQGSESSRPTSPDSEFGSPRFGFVHRKGQPSDFSLNGFVVAEEEGEVGSMQPGKSVFQRRDIVVAGKASAATDHFSLPRMTEDKAPRGSLVSQDEPPHLQPDSQTVQQLSDEAISPITATTTSPTDDLDIEPAYFQNLQPTLHRSISHESLLSISGMDIHIPKHSTSQIFARGRTFIPHPRTPKPRPSLPASQPLASIVEVNASSSSQRSASDTASSILSGLAGPPQSHPSNSNREPTGLSKLVGGWVRGKWGIAPMASTGDLRAQAQAREQQRPMGINQSGVIPGLKGPVRTPSQVHARVLDQGLLMEALVE